LAGWPDFAWGWDAVGGPDAGGIAAQPFRPLVAEIPTARRKSEKETAFRCLLKRGLSPGTLVESEIPCPVDGPKMVANNDRKIRQRPINTVLVRVNIACLLCEYITLASKTGHP
jgi:hypothetical protein